MAIRVHSPSLVQMFEVARSLRMCCSRVARVSKNPSFPSNDGFANQTTGHFGG